MTKSEMAGMLVSPDQPLSGWMRMTNRELELVLEARTAPEFEASHAAYLELQRIQSERGARADLRKAGAVR